MDMEELLMASGDIPTESVKHINIDTNVDTSIVDNNEVIEEKRDKLISAILGGKYVDKKLTVESVKKMNEKDLDKELNRYERSLGAVMVKTLGNSLLQMYTTIVGYFLPIENKDNLLEDLNKDPFLDHAIHKTCCGLYYNYGMILAPLTTTLTTLKHCNFEKTEKINNDIIKNDE